MAETQTALRPVARVLPPEEWAEKAKDFQSLNPEHSVVIVVEDGGPGGAVLAQWGAFTVVHVEGLAIAPEAQGHAGVARALITTMVETLVDRGIVEVLTNAETPEVEGLINHVGGTALPGKTYVIPLTEVPR